MPKFRNEVAPNAKSFHLITQNVDRLSVRALQALESQVPPNTPPSSRPQMDSVFEMHGWIFDVKCTSCDYCIEDLTNPLCPALDVSDIKDYNDTGTKQIDIPLKELPRCPACHALARPSVVWFGETPYQLSEINCLVFKVVMCLVVGTSPTVGIMLTMFEVLRLLTDMFAGAACISVHVPRAETWRESFCVQPHPQRH